MLFSFRPLHPPCAPTDASAADLQLGGILTVADDLLKNDGQKFLEMMEQLADRRMQREEDVAAEFDAISDDEAEDGDADDIDDEEDEEEVRRASAIRTR